MLLSQVSTIFIRRQQKKLHNFKLISIPRQSEALSEEDNKKFRCKRKPEAECSPSEGQCCDEKCKFVPLSRKVTCKMDDDCTYAALCDGSQAKCPDPKIKPDNVTECNEGTQVYILHVIKPHF